MTAFIADATAAPGSAPPRSPVAYTFDAPYSPRIPAIADASPPTNAVTLPPRVRACVRSSSVPDVAVPFDSCEKTQMLLMPMFSFLSSLLVRCLLRFLDDLDGLEVLDDLAE